MYKPRGNNGNRKMKTTTTTLKCRRNGIVNNRAEKDKDY